MERPTERIKSEHKQRLQEEIFKQGHGHSTHNVKVCNH